MSERPCGYCAAPIIDRSPIARYCSKHCGRKARLERESLAGIGCVDCGKPNDPKHERCNACAQKIRRSPRFAEHATLGGRGVVSIERHAIGQMMQYAAHLIRVRDSIENTLIDRLALVFDEEQAV